MSQQIEKINTIIDSQLKEIENCVNKLEGVVDHSSGTTLSEKIESLEELEGIADGVKNDILFAISDIRYNLRQSDVKL